MPTTLIDCINEVLTAVGSRENKTTIAATDSTGYIRDRLNDGLEDLYCLEPFEIDASGTVTITASTRTFSGPADTELGNIHPWSFRINNSNGDIPVDLVTEQWITENYPGFETDEADIPRFVYFDNGLIAVYPLLSAGASSLTLQFSYSTQFVKLTAAAAVFPFEDRSDEMRYIKLFAQRAYEVFKGLGQPGVTNEEMDRAKSRLVVKYMKAKRTGFTSNRRYGR